MHLRITIGLWVAERFPDGRIHIQNLLNGITIWDDGCPDSPNPADHQLRDLFRLVDQLRKNQ